MGQQPQSEIDHVGNFGIKVIKFVSGICILLVALHVFQEDRTEHGSAKADDSEVTSAIPVQPSLAEPVPEAEPKPSKKTYNVLKQQAVRIAPACAWPSDVEKFLSLLDAKRYDLADKIDGCTFIPKGTDVIQIDAIGDSLKQLIWEKDGETLELWSRSYFFKDALRRARDAACKGNDQDCYEKVRKEFQIE